MYSWPFTLQDLRDKSMLASVVFNRVLGPPDGGLFSQCFRNPGGGGCSEEQIKNSVLSNEEPMCRLATSLITTTSVPKGRPTCNLSDGIYDALHFRRQGCLRPCFFMSLSLNLLAA